MTKKPSLATASSFESCAPSTKKRGSTAAGAPPPEQASAEGKPSRCRPARSTNGTNSATRTARRSAPPPRWAIRRDLTQFGTSAVIPAGRAKCAPCRLEQQDPSVVDGVRPDRRRKTAEAVDDGEGQTAHAAEHERAQLERFPEIAYVVPAAEHERDRKRPGERDERALGARQRADQAEDQAQTEPEQHDTEGDLLVEASAE